MAVPRLMSDVTASCSTRICQLYLLGRSNNSQKCAWHAIEKIFETGLTIGQKGKICKFSQISKMNVILDGRVGINMLRRFKQCGFPLARFLALVTTMVTKVDHGN